MHPYLPHTPEEIAHIFETLGISRFEELLEGIPPSYRIQEPLEIPGPLEEQELWKRFQELAEKNWIPPRHLLFLGGGAYPHYIPRAVLAIASKPEFFTSYTPYQPEVSQGTLQVIFEFQTMVCELTGMEVANASMYDGATALAEAVLMAARIREGKSVLIPESLHPFYRSVLATYLKHRGITLLTIPAEPRSGQMEPSHLSTLLREDTIAVVVQSPNFFGVIEDLGAIAGILKEHPALTIACFTEALSLGLLNPPGAFGFEIVVGEGQSLGVPLSYGGPHLGLFATRKEYLRKMPGRIAGMTRDRQGRRGFVLTLSTREQHIRREKATSNICTNEGLCALMMTAYLTLLGPQGLRKLALRNYHIAHRLLDLLRARGFELSYTGPFFNEFVVRHPSALRIHAQLKEQGIVLGIPLQRFFPGRDQELLLCATEVHDEEALARVEEALTSLTSS